jgi:hypothetical protein
MSFGDRKARPVDTPNGRYYADWDTNAVVTREGQLIFFFQFLHTGAGQGTDNLVKLYR